MRAMKCHQGKVVIGTAIQSCMPGFHCQCRAVAHWSSNICCHLSGCQNKKWLATCIELLQLIFRLMLAWSFESRLADISHLAKPSAAEATVRGCTAQGVYRPGWLNIDTSACLAP